MKPWPDSPPEQVEGGTDPQGSRFRHSIIIIEHIMHVIMNLCDRPLHQLRPEIARGATEVANQAVIEAYLGKE
jgi:ABC-type branched-subunit amino acid transport system ATPase component